MAFVVNKKKLNRFRSVSIPRNKDLFFRVGRRPQPPMEDGQVANYASSTMDMIDEAYGTLLKENQIPLDTPMP